MRILLFLLILAVLAVLWFRWEPSEESVARRFVRENPGSTVTNITKGDGDSDGRKYVISYTISPDLQVKTSTWLVYWDPVFRRWDY